MLQVVKRDVATAAEKASSKASGLPLLAQTRCIRIEIIACERDTSLTFMIPSGRWINKPVFQRLFSYRLLGSFFREL